MIPADCFVKSAEIYTEAIANAKKPWYNREKSTHEVLV